MKRGFIRGLWGVYDRSTRVLARRYNIDKDIERIKKNKFNEPFVTYVMGKENYEKMISLGFDCKLISNEPQVFDLSKYQYRNKLEVIKYAMVEDGYDEIVYLDWDVIPQKKIPDNFWDVLHGKEKFQACLQQYRKRKCLWRTLNQRKVPNGGYIYVGDKEIVNEAIRLWSEVGKPDNDEIAWAKLTDNMMGIFDVDTYWDRFEIPFGVLHRGSPHSKENLATKDVYFIHYQG